MPATGASSGCIALANTVNANLAIVLGVEQYRLVFLLEENISVALIGRYRRHGQLIQSYIVFAEFIGLMLYLLMILISA